MSRKPVICCGSRLFRSGARPRTLAADNLTPHIGKAVSGLRRMLAK